MKRFLIILFLLAGISTNGMAQWYFGGSFGIHAGSNSPLSINIAPEAGYFISNNFTVGGRLSYTSYSNRFGIDPYARMYLLKNDSPVRLALSAHVPMYMGQGYFDYGFYLQPGISIATGPNLRFECHLGAIGWGASRQDGQLVSSGWQASISGTNTSVGVVFHL